MKLITHNNKPVFICTEADADTKLAALKSANCLEKNFQVPESDKWEVVEVPCG